MHLHNFYNKSFLEVEYEIEWWSSSGTTHSFFATKNPLRRFVKGLGVFLINFRSLGARRRTKNCCSTRCKMLLRYSWKYFFGYEWLRLTIYKSCVCTLLVFAAFKFGLGSRSLCFNASNFLSQMVYLLLTVAERTNCVNEFLESSVSTNTFYKVRPRRSWKVDIIQDLLSYWHSKSCRKGRAPAGMNNANFSLQSWPVSADQKQGDSRVKRRLLFDVWL